MLAIILCVFRLVRLLGSEHQAVAVENLALQLQLAAYKRKRRRPVLAQWAGCSGSVCAGFGAVGVARWSSFSPTRWSAGNESVFADSGPGSQDPKVLAGEDPLLPAKSAD